MKNKYTIFENDTINLQRSELEIAKLIIKKNPHLPFKINNSTLIFSPYTIGQIQLQNVIIEILPRNSAFTLQNFFEMILFIDSKKFESDSSTISYDHDPSFGIKTLTTHFCKICENLLKEGLTGQIEDQIETSNTVNGTIIFENFHKAKIPLEGVTTSKGEYRLDVVPNQIIKSALKKVLLGETDKKTISKIFSILREFDSISEFTESIEIVESKIEKFYSTNRHYPITLECAIRILKDLKISFKDGNIEWSAFLQNSNTIFEQYVRKVLERGLEEHIEKFKEEKNFANIQYNGKNLSRGISPDILVEYDSKKDSCLAVFDVKNKEFSSEELKSKKAPSSSDIYQLAFYCRRLKTSLGGLIYPSSQQIEPILVSIEDESEFVFMLFAVNMNENIGSRHKSLINQIKKQILSRS
jgi:5-methylcytosine-specific restriction enzyme subunit McrC